MYVNHLPKKCVLIWCLDNYSFLSIWGRFPDFIIILFIYCIYMPHSPNSNCVFYLFFKLFSCFSHKIWLSNIVIILILINTLSQMFRLALTFLSTYRVFPSSWIGRSGCLMVLWLRLWLLLLLLTIYFL